MLSILKHLLESSDVAMSDEVKEAKPHLNRISHMLFGKKCEPVVDDKRGKEAKFFGVANTKSKIVDPKGKSIRLTFDNSTDSGEFEINSLTPLHIVSGEDLDKKIKALYKKHKVQSKKKVNYLDQGGDLVMREIHLGKSPNEHAVKLVRDFLKIIKGETVEDEEKPEEKPEEKKPEEKKVEKPVEKKPEEKKPVKEDSTEDAEILDEAVGTPKVVQVKAKIYLCDITKQGGNGETQWLTKPQGEILYTAYAGGIMVKTRTERGASYYVLIKDDGSTEKERLSFTDDEITKLGPAVKVVLKDK